MTAQHQPQHPGASALPSVGVDRGRPPPGRIHEKRRKPQQRQADKSHHRPVWCQRPQRATPQQETGRGEQHNNQRRQPPGQGSSPGHQHLHQRRTRHEMIVVQPEQAGETERRKFRRNNEIIPVQGALRNLHAPQHDEQPAKHCGNADAKVTWKAHGNNRIPATA